MKKLWALVCVGVAWIAACGGGGASSGSNPDTAVLQSGIMAADGSAMSYGQVNIQSLVDNTKASGTADINGNFAIPASGVTFPALVKVQSLNANKTNYGYITDSRQTDVPVTPLSTLVLSIASGGNPASITSSLAPNAIANAKAAVRSIFLDVFTALSVDSNTDVLSANFKTNHTGLDLLLDAINVQFDPAGNPTLCTKIFNACKTLNLANLDRTAIRLSEDENKALRNAPIASCSAVINTLNTSSITSDSSLYATDFLNSGLNADGYRQAMGNALSGITASFGNPSFVGVDGNSNFVFQFDYYNVPARQYGGSLTLAFNVVNGRCVMVGDQLPFMVQANSSITAQYRVDGTGNLSATTTASPVTGFYFKAGGDGFGGSGVQNTLNINGQTVPIKAIRLHFCDSANNCTPLMDMDKGTGNNGFYYTPGGINTLALKSYVSAGIVSPGDFYNGNPNPIKVEMFDDRIGIGTLRKTAYVKVRGGYIPDNVLNHITLPSVENAQAVLTTASSNPTLNIRIPNGTAVQRVSLTSFKMSNSGQPPTSQKFVLSASDTSKPMSLTIHAEDDYRSIQFNGSSSDGIPILIKYVWAPSCTECS